MLSELALGGSQSIREIENTFEKLKEWLPSGGDVLLDCTDVTTADISFVQILLSARRSVVAAGRTFAVRADAGGSLQQVLEAAGVGGAEMNSFISFVPGKETRA